MLTTTPAVSRALRRSSSASVFAAMFAKVLAWSYAALGAVPAAVLAWRISFGAAPAAATALTISALLAPNRTASTPVPSNVAEGGAAVCARALNSD